MQHDLRQGDNNLTIDLENHLQAKLEHQKISTG